MGHARGERGGAGIGVGGHQRPGVPDPGAAARPWPVPGAGGHRGRRPDRRGDGDPVPVGSGGRPDRRAQGAPRGPGRYGAPRRAHHHGPRHRSARGPPVRRRHVRGVHRVGQRADRRRLVPAAATRARDGHPADGAAARRRGGRRHDRGRGGPLRHRRRALGSRGRGRAGLRRRARDRPRPAATRARPRRSPRTPTARTGSWRACTASRCCWWCRSSWCGPTR